MELKVGDLVSYPGLIGLVMERDDGKVRVEWADGHWAWFWEIHLTKV